MGLVSEILGRFGKSGEKAPRDIAAVEAAIARVASERREAIDAVARAIARRDELLLEDDDKGIAAQDAIADRARLVLEKLEKLSPVLLEELQGLKSLARQRKWEDIQSRYGAAAREFSASFRNTLSLWQSLLAIREFAQNSGFAPEAGALTPPPYTLAPELIASFDAGLDRAADVAAAKAERAIAAAAPAPPPPAAIVAPPGRKQPRPARPAPKPAPPPAKPFEPTVADDGTAQIVILRAGFDLEPGRKSKVGEILSLPKDRAYDLVKATVAEFAEYEERARS